MMKNKCLNCVSLPYIVCQFALHESKSVSLPSFTASERNPCNYSEIFLPKSELHYTSSQCDIDTFDI